MNVTKCLPVSGYEGLYEVSDDGRVRSVNRVVRRSGHTVQRRGIELKQYIDPCGYHRVWLSKDSNTKGKLVHRLVAEAFIDNPTNLPEVNHCDGHKSRNYADNLEWSTRTDNVRHSYKVIGRTNLPGHLRRNARGVQKLTAEGEVLASYRTMHEAARENGILVTSINNCVKGRSRSAGGFIWVNL